jgi:hypothetical protein
MAKTRLRSLVPPSLNWPSKYANFRGNSGARWSKLQPEFQMKTSWPRDHKYHALPTQQKLLYNASIGCSTTFQRVCHSSISSIDRNPQGPSANHSPRTGCDSRTFCNKTARKQHTQTASSSIRWQWVN